MSKQPGFLEHPKVSRGRLPGVIENRGDLARGHGAAVEEHSKQHPAAGGVGQRAEYQLIGVDSRFLNSIRQ